MPSRISLILLTTLVITGLQGCTGALIIGGATGISMAQDRRTAGAYVEDQNIELKAGSALAKHKDIADKAHISVTSFNHIVLLSGEVTTAEMKQRAEKIVRGIKHVRIVHNELTIGEPSSLGQRTKDSWITTKVKTNLLSVKIKDFNPERVKVVTEKGIVYLMGIVTRAEADKVAEVVRTTSGVRKVVKIFEYL